MEWKTIKEHGPPPFDKEVVVKGTKNDEQVVAFNQCYPPYINMLECKSYNPVVFEIEAWCEI